MTTSDNYTDFRENVMAYAPEIKQKNDGGSYYVEKIKTNDTEENITSERPKKNVLWQSCHF